METKIKTINDREEFLYILFNFTNSPRATVTAAAAQTWVMCSVAGEVGTNILLFIPKNRIYDEIYPNRVAIGSNRKAILVVNLHFGASFSFC